jgi:hypothetical protein
VRVGIPSLRESGGSTLRGKLRARVFLVVCVAPLRLGGLRGKKSTPSVGWEVPVKSPWLASGRSRGTPVAEYHHQVHIRRLRRRRDSSHNVPS